MEVFLFYIIFSIIVGVAAGARGRSGLGWFFISLLISPLLGILAVLVMPNLANEQAETRKLHAMYKTHVKCPDCAELVKAEAKVCKHCGCRLIPQRL